ncbi:MAG: DEAD/DEAH box helicase [Leptospiraceae bacterium]|nr:DEAD/DEAH box helicase [Leptospiraceae bacterium]
MCFEKWFTAIGRKALMVIPSRRGRLSVSIQSQPESIGFEGLGLPEPLLRAIASLGYEAPSPVQTACIPPLLAGRDITGQAETGTGKTAAFALPMLARLDIENESPQLMVLTPTRELAIQVAEAIVAYARFLGTIHVLPVYGGQAIEHQLRRLRRGVHVIVGTPGRVIDHLRRGTLKIDGLRSLVLDEADEMLNMGFLEDVEWILGKVPTSAQIGLFSATMPRAIQKIASDRLKDPVEIRTATTRTAVTTIHQRYILLPVREKLEAITRLLELEGFDAAIVFVRTRNASTELAEKLEARGHSTAALNGDMTQAQREKTIDRFRSGRLDVLIATDVAARGLDVERVGLVINYDMPADAEAYVHRIGRTGRAGRNGEAILFVTPREQRMLQSIQRAISQKMDPMEIPTPADVVRSRRARLREKIASLIADDSAQGALDLVDEITRELQIEPRLLAAALSLLSSDSSAIAAPVERTAPSSGRRSESRERKDRFESRSETRSAGRTERSKQRDDTAGRQKKAPREAATGRAAHAQPSEGDKSPRLKIRKKSREAGGDDGAMPTVRYRIEVGREHGVEARNIVGAIANEAGLESRYIGAIRIEADHSTIELPDGMPKEIFQHLKNVHICNRKIAIRVDGPDTGYARPKRDVTERTTRKPGGARGPGPSAAGRPGRKGPRSAGHATAKRPQASSRRTPSGSGRGPAGRSGELKRPGTRRPSDRNRGKAAEA